MYFTSDQIMIVLLGISSIVCISSTIPKIMRYGFLFGMLAEPFWMVSAYNNGQWGIFCICIVYGLCHLRGYLLTVKGIKNTPIQ